MIVEIGRFGAGRPAWLLATAGNAAEAVALMVAQVAREQDDQGAANVREVAERLLAAEEGVCAGEVARQTRLSAPVARAWLEAIAAASRPAVTVWRERGAWRYRLVSRLEWQEEQARERRRVAVARLAEELRALGWSAVEEDGKLAVEATGAQLQTLGMAADDLVRGEALAQDETAGAGPLRTCATAEEALAQEVAKHPFGRHDAVAGALVELARERPGQMNSVSRIARAAGVEEDVAVYCLSQLRRALPEGLRSGVGHEVRCYRLAESAEWEQSKRALQERDRAADLAARLRERRGIGAVAAGERVSLRVRDLVALIGAGPVRK